MNRLQVLDFNFNITLLGGQAFCWDYYQNENMYIGVTRENVIKIKVVDNNNILWQTYPQKDDFSLLSSYLRLKDDYQNILNTFPKDEYLKKAVKKYFGLRLLNQDFTQTLLSYICSSTKSIKGIRQCTRLLAKKYGDVLLVDGQKYHLFPNPERLSQTTISEILETKVGFRGKYLIEASKRLVNGDINENSTRDEIKSLNGVGDKIADCVLVYSKNRDDITPLDIWGKRFLTKYYNLDEKMKYQDMSLWASEYFGKYTSWAGQYLFEYIRSIGV